LKNYKKKQLSVDEIGYHILKNQLEQVQFPHIKEAEELLNYLAEGNSEQAHTLIKNLSTLSKKAKI